MDKQGLMPQYARLKAALQAQYDRRYSSWHSGAEEDEQEPADMQELQALIKEIDGLEADHHYLSWFCIYSDFGPADEDVRHEMRARYTDETGREIPHGWGNDE